MTYTYDKPYELMEKLASNLHQMMYDRITRSNVPEVIQIDAFNPLSAQIAALSKQMQNLENKTQVHAQVAQVLSYDFCKNDHSQE